MICIMRMQHPHSGFFYILRKTHVQLVPLINLPAMYIRSSEKFLWLIIKKYIDYCILYFLQASLAPMIVPSHHHVGYYCWVFLTPEPLALAPRILGHGPVRQRGSRSVLRH